MRNKDRGFTLVELIIVMAIMGILAGIAAPNYQSFMAQRRLKGAARQVMSHLMQARMQAVTQNNNYKVVFANDHEYQTLDDNNSNGAADTGEALETRNIRTDYPDVTFSNTPTIIFYPRGTADADAYATITSAAGSKIVRVSLTGRIKID